MVAGLPHPAVQGCPQAERPTVRTEPDREGAGAIALVKFSFEQVNRAWTEPNPNLLPTLTHPHCTACVTLQDQAEAMAAQNQRYDGDPASTRDITLLPDAPPGQLFFTMTLHQNAANTIDSWGRVHDQHVVKVTSRRVAVSWEGDRWMLFAVA